MVEQVFGIDLKIIMKFLIDFIDIKYKILFKKKYKFWLKIVDILIVIKKKFINQKLQECSQKLMF